MESILSLESTIKSLVRSQVVLSDSAPWTGSQESRTLAQAPTSCLQRCLSSVGAGWFCSVRGSMAGVLSDTLDVPLAAL